MTTPATVMIFAAGLGTRMGALTAHTPKPMLEVAGVPLLGRMIDWADAAGLTRIVVNTHYLGDQIEKFLADRPDILISHEPERALETGGGLKAALPLISENPVFTANPDAIWTGENPFATLASHWDPARMDGLLLLQSLEKAQNHAGRGDFYMTAEHRLERFAGQGAAHAYTGVQILRTDLVDTWPDDRFSLNVIWDKMLAAGRLFGAVHTGDWVDVGTPSGLTVAEQVLAQARDV